MFTHYVPQESNEVREFLLFLEMLFIIFSPNSIPLSMGTDYSGRPVRTILDETSGFKMELFDAADNCDI